jgi:hypothetical protein
MPVNKAALSGMVLVCNLLRFASVSSSNRATGKLIACRELPTMFKVRNRSGKDQTKDFLSCNYRLPTLGRAGISDLRDTL